MKFSKICFSSVLCSFLFGCTMYIPITENYDEFSQAKTVKMDNCELEANYPSKLEAIIFDQGNRKLELNLEYVKSNEQEELWLVSEITTENEAFTIDDGESLIFVIDEEVVKLATKGGYGSDLEVSTTGLKMTRSYSSKAKYSITKELISKIANGTVVKARILGFDLNASDADKPSLEGVFEEAHKNAYKEFLDKINPV